MNELLFIFAINPSKFEEICESDIVIHDPYLAILKVKRLLMILIFIPFSKLAYITPNSGNTGFNFKMIAALAPTSWVSGSI
jgi:hypothetical protein